MKDRILEFLRKENKTSSQFAEEIGVQPSSISHILSGRNKPSLDFVIKMLETYSELQTDWLIFGKGNMYPVVNSDNQLSGEAEENFPGGLFDDISPENGADMEDELSQPGKLQAQQSRELPVDSVRTLSKVILLYSDGTFSEFRK